ncbi:MAG: outer membrane lipoprotein-sorting protein [Candidatus Eisenbacteria sp.]|nr:outer membrane lipoprotein-sorting protein [Candidatus Eisenbacteria bacterium]
MRGTLLLMVMPWLLFGSVAKAQDTEGLPTLDILRRSDLVVNAPQDQEFTLSMILIDKKGKEKTREAKIWQKGADMRMVKFTSPADQEGIGFLDLPDDLMYVYLPAFKKVRRIASHVKNESFAGTDFTYDDMATINYSEEYDPELLGADTTKCLVLEDKEGKAEWVSKELKHYRLELTPKAGMKKDYSKLIIWIRSDNFYQTRIEYYDQRGNLWKIQEKRKIKEVDGYWTAMEVEMSDLAKNHKTRNMIAEIAFDQGLTDKFFTQRQLKRRPK